MSRGRLGVVVAVVGAAVLLVSALADVIGVGDDDGFGNKQTIGVVVGAVVLVAGLALVAMARRAPS